MTTIVMKFGGTSVASIDRIKNVANIIENKKKEGCKLAIIVSAMAGVTNDLVEKSKSISNHFSNEEYDVLLSSGEQVTSALLAGCLVDKGIQARSMLGWQIPIVTEGQHKNSRIISVNSKSVQNYLEKDYVVVIPGFQGISEEMRISTIGRGGSDASAVALAKALDADRCEIYNDVEGVFTTNPDICEQAKKIDKISYDEMLEMASLGAKVMQPTSVQDAKINNISFSVKSSFVKKKGTLITGNKKAFSDQIITGITSTKNDAKITMIGVKDKPGVAASIFKPLSLNQINVDMVVQNISLNSKETDLTFTIKSEDLKKTEKIVKKNKRISFRKLTYDNNVSKVSIIGVGMITTPGITYRMFQALASKKINIMVISTSEIKISVLISNKQIKKAVAVLHKEFKLD